jgi:hypothetical protein
MASNIFSDWLAPVANYLNNIPVVGQVLQWADKFAANTDPSQLTTSFGGKSYNKLFNTDAADIYTSEEARTGAAHSIGTIYGLGSMDLGGLFRGGGEAAPIATEGAGAGGEIGFGESAGMGSAGTGTGETTSGYTAGMGQTGEQGATQVVKSKSLASTLSDGVKLSNQVKAAVGKPAQPNYNPSNMNGRTLSGDTENVNTPSSSPTDLNYARSKQAADHYKKIAKMLKMAQEIAPELWTPELAKGLADAFKLDPRYTMKNPYNQEYGGK